MYFHDWLMKHPKLSRYSKDVTTTLRNSVGDRMGYSGWNEIFVALKIIQEAHHKDARMNNEQPYLIHQFEIISDYLKKYPQKNINLHDILILLLHDTIEDHPEYWKQILEQF